VQQLHHRRQPDRAPGFSPRVAIAQKQERGPQALAPTTKQIAGNLRDGLERGRTLPRQFFLDQREIFAYEIENLLDRY
jgi:hypothetical protein